MPDGGGVFEWRFATIAGEVRAQFTNPGNLTAALPPERVAVRLRAIITLLGEVAPRETRDLLIKVATLAIGAVVALDARGVEYGS
jgi:hypothetical protein